MSRTSCRICTDAHSRMENFASAALNRRLYLVAPGSERHSCCMARPLLQRAASRLPPLVRATRSSQGVPPAQVDAAGLPRRCSMVQHGAAWCSNRIVPGLSQSEWFWPSGASLGRQSSSAAARKKLANARRIWPRWQAVDLPPDFPSAASDAQKCTQTMKRTTSLLEGPTRRDPLVPKGLGVPEACSVLLMLWH